MTEADRIAALEARIAALEREAASRDRKIAVLAELASARDAEWRALVLKQGRRLATLTKRVAAEKKAKQEPPAEQQATEPPTTEKRGFLGGLLPARNGASESVPEAPPKRKLSKPEKVPRPPSLTDPEADIAWAVRSPAIARGRGRLGRAVVYTAIVGGYDEVRDPVVIDAAVDYVLFTDGPVPPVSIWEPRPLQREAADPTRTARYVKLHPHLLLPEYERAVWVDGNIQLRQPPEALLTPDNAEAAVITWKHPVRDCIYDELEECLRRDKDDPEVMRRQVEAFRAAGYPAHNGLIESSVMIFRHRDPAVAALLDAWWRIVETGSRRDQLAFNVALHRSPGVTLGFIPEAEGGRHHDPRLRFHGHRRADEPAENP